VHAGSGKAACRST